MGGYRLGVDFGTSNTVAVLRWPDGHVRPLLFDGSPLLPSAVFAESASVLLVGHDAVHTARVAPGSFEPHPKRRVDDGTVLLGSAEFAVVDLFAAVFARVAAEVERVAPERPSTVVVTHPAAWGPHRRDLITAAAAVLGPVLLVPEPVAAAAYLVQMAGSRVPVGGHAVVYDLGAGTFDATLLRRTAGGFDVLATRGLDDTGGLDVDAALVSALGATFGSRDPELWQRQRLVAPATAADRRASAQLWTDVRTAKETLSRRGGTLVHVPLVDADAPVGREQLDEVARPVVDRTVEATRSVIRQAGLEPSDVAGAFLVGGASRMPLVATRLHATLGLAAFVTEQPEMVVAEGSLYADPPPPQAFPAAPQPFPAAKAAPVSLVKPALDSLSVEKTRGVGWRRPALVAAAAVVAVVVAVVAVVLQQGDRDPGGTPSPAADRFTLGYVQTGTESVWRVAQTRSIQEAAGAANVDLVFADGEGRQQLQVDAIRSLIERKVDVIAFSPVVTVGWDTVLGEAKAAGIPVVLVDRAVETGEAALYRSVLGSDYVAEGRKAGEWVVRTAGSGPVNIAELRGTRGSSVADDRSRGFTTAIAGDSRLRVVVAESGDFTRSGGEERMRVMLARFQIDVVFAHNDDMGIGALRAIEAAGHTPGTDIRIVSIDGVRDAMTELVAGRLNYIVECSPLLGPQLMTLARTVHAGDPVPARVATEETTFDQNQARAALPGRRY